MPSFSPLLKRFAPSNISAMTDIAAKICAQGRHMYNFSTGEPDFDTPKHICQAAKSAIDNGDTKYTPSAGSLAMREAICRKYQKDNHLNFSLNQVVVGNGAKPLLTDILRTLVTPGAEVILVTPCWTCHPGMVKLIGAQPKLVKTTQANGFRMQPEDLQRAISDKTQVIILNAPSNPSGVVYDQRELSALADVVKKHQNIWVVTDDLYEHIVFDGRRCANLLEVAPELKNRTILVNGVSKAFAMTGWRVGYAVGPDAVITNIVKLMSQGTGCACSISQAAAIAALDGPLDCVREFTAAYEARRNYAVSALNDIPGIHCTMPDGAFYLYPCCRGVLGLKTTSGKTIETSADFVAYLLQDYAVITVPGVDFELDPYIRLSIASSMEQIKQGIGQIQLAVNNLT